MTKVTVKHRFSASAERVYDAWLGPAKVPQFLYTTATGEIVRCEIDARVGGTYQIIDRRDGEDILHEGTYLLNRPTSLVFTLRVPKYSPQEDRVSIRIAALSHGCELTLTTETSDEWADDTQLGWTMILDVLDETLPAEKATCGGGLAQHAGVPRRFAVYLSELAKTLELHRDMLVLEDTASRAEDEVYRELASSYRGIAAQLTATAERMLAQRELAMGAHDESKWTDAHLKAFGRFVHEQGSLVSVLRAAAYRDEAMLASMRKK